MMTNSHETEFIPSDPLGHPKQIDDNSGYYM